MNPTIKTNLVLSAISSAVIVGVFYLWTKNDTTPPTVRHLVKLFLVCLLVNFGFVYTLQNNMIPKSLTGGGSIVNTAHSSSAPWSAQEPSVDINKNNLKLTEIDLNEPSF